MMMAAVHIGMGGLSFCFKSLGNIVRCLFNDCSGLFGVCSEFVRGCVCSPRGLAPVRSCSEFVRSCSEFVRETFHHCLIELSLIWQSLMTVYVYA